MTDGTTTPKWYAGTVTPPGLPAAKLCYISNPNNRNQIFIIIEDGSMGVVEIVSKKPEGI